ncbi:unnamed protein product [Rotaria sp. Silwood1]|nr:unnamed protein product [Rotaria sp. Silwood1]CAF1643369.1 unnamed protein product [Rotaria sp. Silwood1]CAF3871623.1 unnamed protein product [Rotaria sp. Silwood1]CAF5001010.1 unnamed protein product [Rotaria sp. Silwood1]
MYALQTILNNDQLQLDETTEKLLSQLRERNKIVSLDLKQFVETYLIEIASLTDKRDTSKHEQQITVWRRERQEQLDYQIHRFVTEQKKRI